jgi:hypothetical protein
MHQPRIVQRFGSKRSRDKDNIDRRMAMTEDGDDRKIAADLKLQKVLEQDGSFCSRDSHAGGVGASSCGNIAALNCEWFLWKSK